MATAGEDEVEYESDPEEAKLSLAMRRREASDDEEEEDETEKPSRRIDPRMGMSDVESDGQGGAADYDDEESDVDDEEEEEEVEEEEIEEEEEEVEEVEDEEEGGNFEEVRGGGGKGAGEGSVVVTEVVKELGAESTEVRGADHPGGEEEKKENEPFAVPTAGAFYMHDDRFRDNAGGRHR